MFYRSYETVVEAAAAVDLLYAHTRYYLVLILVLLYSALVCVAALSVYLLLQHILHLIIVWTRWQ